MDIISQCILVHKGETNHKHNFTDGLPLDTSSQQLQCIEFAQAEETISSYL